MSNPVLERLQRHGLRPRKELGQHFLVDIRVIDRLVEIVAPAPGQTLLEYGAGLGVLTEKLLDAGARVVAVELDDDLARILDLELGERAGFRLLHADLARVSARAIRVEEGAPDLRLVGNLPYQLTSHVLFGVLDLGPELHDAVFMVQREVAERIVAAPGGRDYGILSVLLQTWFDVDVAMRVRPGAFLPPPRVDSAVLRIRRPGARAAPLEWAERDALVRLVKSVFNERRKVLRNTLKKFYCLDTAALDRCAASSGIDLGRRPETLDSNEFAQLLRALPAPVSGAGGEPSTSRRSGRRSGPMHGGGADAEA
jgi:16S rRNA (adenine1518-N6/adenine1519-N6)-dimethyltransferase